MNDCALYASLNAYLLTMGVNPADLITTYGSEQIFHIRIQMAYDYLLQQAFRPPQLITVRDDNPFYVLASKAARSEMDDVIDKDQLEDDLTSSNLPQQSSNVP